MSGSLEHIPNEMDLINRMPSRCGYLQNAFLPLFVRKNLIKTRRPFAFIVWLENVSFLHGECFRSRFNKRGKEIRLIFSKNSFRWRRCREKL